MLLGSIRRFQDRMKEISDCVKGIVAPPEFEPCYLADIVESVIKALSLLAAEKKVSLYRESLNDLPPIQADKRRLFNAFYNLVNNALEEVPPGGHVTIRGKGLSGDGMIQISTEDTGRGMPSQVQDSLFSNRAISRKPGGTGLGTKIIKDVMDLHHGKIRVESKEGIGTTFFLSLPIQQQGNSEKK